MTRSTASDVRDTGRLGSLSPSDFVFVSPHCGIHASGTGLRVNLPASDARETAGSFKTALGDAFRDARRAGIDDPIVVGAIPFDHRRPACLYVPQAHTSFDPTEVSGGCRPAEASVRLASSAFIPDRQGYEAGVASVLAAIEQGTVEKAVLARLLELEFQEPLDHSWLLRRLMVQNPGSWQFHAPLPDGGNLIGASPELLVRKAGALIQCNPLAGSAHRHPDVDVDADMERRLSGSDKDLREHRYVVDWMSEVLRPHCETLDFSASPSTRATPSLWHLSTTIEGILQDPAISVLELAWQLHPTPALCGHPGIEARDLIRCIEPFDREVLGGIVGWCDSNGDGEWALAIRCGVLRGKGMRLFAGAGIVAGSEPAFEWLETSAKLSIMLSALGLPASVAG